VQLCRSLKTYGITTYIVKFKNKKKKWEVSARWCLCDCRLKLRAQDMKLGVTRDSILKMNAETNEVEKSYPLTHLRRWAASGDT
jgi:talin